jgi:hypothetical protein
MRPLALSRSACDYALAAAGATGDEGSERCQMISGAILINLYVKHGTAHRPIRKVSDYKPLITASRDQSQVVVCSWQQGSSTTVEWKSTSAGPT